MSDDGMMDDHQRPPSPIKASKKKEEKKSSSSSSSSFSDSTDLPWVEKHRPKNLDDLISHQHIIDTLNRLVDAKRLPHLLFYGPPGTGKTSTILALARKINGANYRHMVLELNASDERGIETVRETIKDFASSRQLFSSGMKLVILDEADSMTRVAQDALRRMVEKYTKNTRFCFICNYVNKIIPALQSRCTRFRFGPLEKSSAQLKLREVAEKEGCVIPTENSGLDAVIKLGEGDMRKCLNILQATHLSYGLISEDNVYSCTGQPTPSDIDSIFQTLINASLPHAFLFVQEKQNEKGLSLVDILARLGDLIPRVSFPPRVLSTLLERLAEIEYRLACGSSEKVQAAAFVAAFQLAKHETIQWENDPNAKNIDEAQKEESLHVAEAASDWA